MGLLYEITPVVTEVTNEDATTAPFQLVLDIDINIPHEVVVATRPTCLDAKDT